MRRLIQAGLYLHISALLSTLYGKPGASGIYSSGVMRVLIRGGVHSGVVDEDKSPV